MAMATRYSSQQLAGAGILAVLLTIPGARGDEVTFAAHQLPGVPGDADPPLASATSAAYPEGDFTAQMTAARGEGGYGPGSACDWGWGCGGSPFLPGPGKCDNWRVGPHWDGSVSGLVMFREDLDLNALAAAATAGGAFTPPTDPIDIDSPGTFSNNFEFAPGARLMLSSYYPQCRGYEFQVGYLGVFGWDAGAFDPDVPVDGPLPLPPGVEQQRSLTYQSVLHSLEFNAQSLSESPIATYGGVRYVFLGEDVNDLLEQNSQFPVAPPNAGADPPLVGDPPLEVTDILRRVSVDNHMIGMHGGLRTDLLRLGQRFYLEGFVDGGVYCNVVTRKSGYSETRRYVALDDPSTGDVNEGVNNVDTNILDYRSERQQVAFVGEAMLGGVYEINRCTRARLGYQLLYLSGVELGYEAFEGAGPGDGDLFMHGWFAGVEYSR